jgi:hypothetical protein
MMVAIKCPTFLQFNDTEKLIRLQFNPLNICVCVYAQEYTCLMHMRGVGGEDSVPGLSLSHTRARVRAHVCARTKSETLTHTEAIFKKFRILSYQEVFSCMAKNIP